MLRLAWIILTAVPALLAGPVVVPDASTTEATPVTSIDCSNRDNGFYSIGCTQNFTECHLKKAYNKPCPKHLYFHSRLGRCEYKVDIPECRNPSQSAGIIFASPPEFQCGNRTDGFYSHPHIPCDKSYYVCLKGHVMRMACGYQQFYDVVKQRCEFKSRVPACKGKQISGRDYTLSEGSQSNQAPAAPSQVPYGQQTFSQDQTAPPAPPPAEITSNKVTPNVQPHEGAPDCANLADGVFADTKVACSRFFWKCAHKTLFKYECPSELFYDKEVDRCDHKKFVPMCGGTRPATTPTPPAQDSVPVDFDCSGKTDGFHVKKRCDSTFYSCLAGTTQRLTCSAGLSFDDRVNYCDYPLACQQDRPETTRPPMDQSYNVIQSDPTAAPLPSVDFSCVGRNDGRFALGKCINDYVVCTNGNAMKMSCPASLLFDGTHCNFQDVCMSPPSTAQTADVPANPYGSVPQIPQDAPSSPKPPSYNPIPTVPVRTTTSPPTYAQTLPARSEPQAGGVNCVNLENGPQASERCSSNYVVCDNGLTVRQSCPHDLIYNPYEKSCDYKESVEGCGNGNNVGQDVPLVPVASTSAPQLTNPYGQAKPSQDKTADKCASLADGIYAEGCSNYYIQCLRGISYKQDCPAGLFYNRKTEICDHKQRVRACGGKEEISPVPTASLTADAPAYGVGSANDQPQVNTGNQCTETSIENSGCNTFYFQCVFGKIARMQCAPSLYYNPDEHICDWKKNIVACGGTAPTAAAAADEAVQAIPYSQKTGTILNQDSEADNFCMNKDNGFYAAGCQTFGYACVVGSTKRFNCPGGTYFNPDNNKCEWKENVPVCGGTSPTTAAPAQSPPAVAAAGGYNNLPIAEGAGALAADIPLKPFCEHLADGYFADGCNSFFYYCRSGVTQRLNCPSGTFYDIRKKDCHRREDVPACNSQLVETTQQLAQSPSVPSSSYGSPAQQSPPSQPSFDCSGKQDGLYSLPECTPIFIQCYNQAVVKQSCQNGLFYNKENGMCDYRENVSACGGRIPATTTTTTTPAPVQQTPATARPYPAAAIAADTPLDATCTGKEDGYYADGCTSRYYSCQGGNIAQHSCQHNLRFDQIRLRCDFDENIEACGGKTPEEDTPAATAAPYGARQSIQQDTAQQASFDCKGKKDGLYPLSPCNKEYVACSNERVFTRKCNNGLFYDDDKKFCDFLARVAGCGAQPSQPAQSPTLPSQPYGSTATSAPFLPSRDEISFDCSGKTDGFYETVVKCSINYVQCSNKIAYNGKCPEGLVFNTASGLCDYTASTAGCSNYVPATTQAPQLPAQSQPQQPQQQYPGQQPLPTQPAQSQPQQQYPGQAQTLPAQSQPQPLAPIQPQQQYTALEQTLPELSQPIQQQTLPSQPAQSQQSPMTTQEFSCSGQPDGIYGSICGTQYWKCSGGMTFPQKCSPNTVFDGVSGGCDFSAKIAACQNNGI